VLAERVFFNPDRNVKFYDAMLVSNDRGYNQWLREAIEKKHMFANE